MPRHDSRNQTKGGMERIGDGPVLFAYDASEYAKAAIREAAHQLEPGRAAVVLTVWEPAVSLAFAGPAGGVAPGVEQAIEEQAGAFAEEGAGLATMVGFRARALTQSGSPTWRTIVTAADELDAGIVVMGSHGRTGIRLVLMGSVAAAVASHTERPVLIVHAPAGADQRAA